jgi:hypothetical protein
MNHASIATFVLVCSLAWSLSMPKSSVGAADGLSAEWLPGTEISRLLGGKMLEGRYASGRAFIERYLPDGRIEYLEDGNAIGGHWSITAGTLCTIYDTEPAGGCFRVSRSGANCFEFYFVARTEATAPGPEGAKPSWTARGSVSGEPNACQDESNV